MQHWKATLTNPQITFTRLMSLVAMAVLWTGSQIPVYLFGMPSNVCVPLRLESSSLQREVNHGQARSLHIYMATSAARIVGYGL